MKLSEEPKPFLTLDGQEAVGKNITHAHYALLGALLKSGRFIEHLEETLSNTRHNKLCFNRVVKTKAGLDFQSPPPDYIPSSVLNDEQNKVFYWLKFYISEWRNNKSEAAKTMLHKILKTDFILGCIDEIELDGKSAAEARFALKLKQSTIDMALTHYQPLIMGIARDSNWDNDDLNDVVQDAQEGFVKGISKYDYARGTAIATYVSYWITETIKTNRRNRRSIMLPSDQEDLIGRISKYAEKFHKTHGWHARSDEIAAGLGITEKTVEGAQNCNVINFDTTTQTPHAALTQQAHGPELIAANLDEAVNQSLAILEPEELTVISHLFGFENQEALSVNKIRFKTGMPESRIIKLRDAAYQKLRANPELLEFLRAA